MRLLPLLLLLACQTGPTAPCEQAFWLDNDGDGFGGRAEVWIGCAAPPGYVAGPADCADADAQLHPGANELCDEVDNDCDGEVDEEPWLPLLLYKDGDGDGFGTADRTRYGCPEQGWATSLGDCDDSAGWIHPDAEETCDDLDRNCDGHPVIGAVDGEPWFKDNDGDGFGRSANSTTGCGDPDPGWVLNEDDCSDTNAQIFPGAAEGLFDGVDSDCDGFELCPYDGDGDGWGGASTIVADMGCTLVGSVGNTDDCDDSDPLISPDAVEVWYSGVDEDCNPLTRDDDLDEDGFGQLVDCDDWDPQTNPNNPPPGSFTDVGLALGLSGVQWDPVAQPPLCPSSIEYMSGGAAVADYDNDGRHDIFLPVMYAPDRLYRQLPDGSFEEVGAAAGVDWAGSSNGALWVDVEGDGDLDLAVVMVGAEPNRLYINDGAGGFTEEGQLRGFDLPLGVAECARQWSVSAGDYDGDGDLDLHTTAWHFPVDLSNDRSRLFDNDGTGFFTDVTAAVGLDLPTRSGFSSAFVDPDDDGDLELALTADFGDSGLFRNDGGIYTEITGTAGVGTDENGMGADWGDIDGDGDLDWFVTSIWDDFTVPCDQNWGCTGNRLYRNEGGLLFSDATDATGLRDGAWGWGAAFFDVDHDGDLDLGQQNGMMHAGFESDVFRMFVNDGTGAFAEEGCDRRTDGMVGQGRSVVPFDVDDDGDLDLLLTFTAGVPKLLRNDGAAEAGSWLRLHLSDPGSANPFAVGATVRATPTGGGATQLRALHANSTFAAAGPPEVHFGLAGATAVDLEITWPNGAVQLESAVPVDQELVIGRTVP